MTARPAIPPAASVARPMSAASGSVSRPTSSASGQRRPAAARNRAEPAPGSTTRAGVRARPAHEIMLPTTGAGVNVWPAPRRRSGGLIRQHASPAGAPPARIRARTPATPPHPVPSPRPPGLPPVPSPHPPLPLRAARSSQQSRPSRPAAPAGAASTAAAVARSCSAGDQPATRAAPSRTARSARAYSPAEVVTHPIVPAPGGPAEHMLRARRRRSAAAQDKFSGNVQDRGVKLDYSPWARKVGGIPIHFGVSKRLYG